MSSKTKTVSTTPRKKIAAKRARPRATSKESAIRGGASARGARDVPVVLVPRTSPQAVRQTPSAPANARRVVSSEERYRMIQQAAYYMAEGRRFQTDPAWCWLRAEEEIDRTIAGA